MPLPVYEFGDIRVDRARVTVTRDGRPVALEPKTFDVLCFLIEHRDHLVSKEELLDAVWKDTFVTANVLTRAVAQLRKAIGDDAREARYIETATKRGYRFIAPVNVAVPPEEPSPAESGGEPPAGGDPPLAKPPRAVPVAWLLMSGVVLVALGWGATFLRRPAAPAPATLPALRRLTTQPGYNGGAAVSADGRSVAYVSDRTGSLEIFVTGQTLEGRELAITSDGGQNIQPEWSADGQWLAFHSRQRGGIWIVPSAGGSPRQIVEFGSGPSWSPDGDRLVFTSDAGGMVAESELWTVRRDGSDRRQLTQAGRPPGGHRMPSWSHDGRSVVFVVEQGGIANRLWVVAVDDGHLTELGNFTGFAAFPRFSPQDDFVYWAGDYGVANGALWRSAVDGGGGPRGQPEALMPIEGGLVDGLSIARDGTLVYSVATDDSNLWAVDVSPAGDAGEPVPLTDDAPGNRNTYPDYSSDGRIAYTRRVVGHGPSTWIVEEDGRHREPLGIDPPSRNPHWRADGKALLVWQGGELDGGLVWVDAATRRTTKVPFNAQGLNNVRLSPDGREIAYHWIQPEGTNVWTRALDGKPPRQVTFGAEAVTYPAWSPDGRSLAVEIKRGDQTHIGVVSREGGAVEMLVEDRGQNWPHSWAPDGDRIAFAGERGGVWNIWAVSRRTRTSRRLTQFTSASGYVRYPSWSPQGRRIVFERSQRTGSVWSVVLK